MVRLGITTRLSAKQGSRGGPSRRGGASGMTDEQLWRLGPKAVRGMNRAAKNPDMPPNGPKPSRVYVLGGSPDAPSDKRGTPFAGPPGRILRALLPEGYSGHTVFDNVVRTYPPKDREPKREEVECYRKVVEASIAEHRPKVVLALGAVAARWWLGKGTSVFLDRGRVFPARIGGHDCWFMPTYHPSYVLRVRSEWLGQREAALWDRDVQRAFLQAEKAPPEVFGQTAKELDAGITCIYGTEPGALDRLVKILRQLRTRKRLSVDVETTGIRPYAKGSKVLSTAIGTYGRTVSFPIDHPQAVWTRDQRKVLLIELRKTLLSARITAHNLGMEQEWFAHLYGDRIVHAARWHCTMQQAYVLDERPKRHSLDYCCLQHLGVRLKSASGVDRANLADAPLSKVLPYNGRDTKHTDKLFLKQREQLKAVGRWGVYQKIQLPRVGALTLAQRRGVLVSSEVVGTQHTKTKRELERETKLLQDIPEVRRYNRSHGKFNPQSSHDVLRCLRMLGQMGGKDKSTDESALKRVGGPVAEGVLTCRKLNKRLSTYLSPFVAGGEKSVLWPDNRLHTSFNTTFTATGRLSSSDPNMQNFPKRDPELKKLRRMVVASPGCLLISADFGQIEARVLGMASRDPRFVEMLWTDYDVHMYWSERIASLYPKSVRVHGGSLKALRSAIKNKWVFPAFYGATLRTVARHTQIPEQVLSPLFDEFWRVFKGVKKWQDGLERYYKKNHEVPCLTGRVRHGPLTPNELINAPIQGTASDLVVDAMTRLSLQAHHEDKPWLQPVLNIHDDLTFDVPKERADDALEDIVVAMLNVPFDFVNVPMLVEVEQGPDWYDMSPVGEFNSRDIFGQTPTPTPAAV